MAIIRRFSTIRQGGIVFKGNTAGLSPVNATGGQIAGSIAVFTSLNSALQVAGYPAVTDVTEYSVIPYYSPQYACTPCLPCCRRCEAVVLPAPPATVCECTPFARANFGSCRRVRCGCHF